MEAIRDLPGLSTARAVEGSVALMKSPSERRSLPRRILPAAARPRNDTIPRLPKWVSTIRLDCGAGAPARAAAETTHPPKSAEPNLTRRTLRQLSADMSLPPHSSVPPGRLALRSRFTTQLLVPLRQPHHRKPVMLHHLDNGLKGLKIQRLHDVAIRSQLITLHHILLRSGRR